MVRELTPAEFVTRRAAGEMMTLVDVREPWEVQLAPAPTDFVHIPMGDISARLNELDPNAELVVLCRSGARSGQVAAFLDSRRFKSVANLAGGILEWSRTLDPSIPQY